MESIRVVLFHMPGMLGDILRNAVAGQPDMTVAGEIADQERLAPTVQRADPDVIIIGAADGDLPPFLQRVMEASPRLKILVVAADGREVVLHELRPNAIPVLDVSVESILREIRRAVHDSTNSRER
jgi:chemotaxis response regulator CheB